MRMLFKNNGCVSWHSLTYSITYSLYAYLRLYWHYSTAFRLFLIKIIMNEWIMVVRTLAILNEGNIGIIGPIPWGHSGPLCHALSLSSSSSSSLLSSLWTSMWRRRAIVQWRQLVNWREAARCGEWAQHFFKCFLFYLSMLFRLLLYA